MQIQYSMSHHIHLVNKQISIEKSIKLDLSTNTEHYMYENYKKMRSQNNLLK